VRLDPVAAAAERPDHHVTSPSVEESIGRWRRELREGVAERIWNALDSRLTALGYTRD
jgi:hypothetical protein